MPLQIIRQDITKMKVDANIEALKDKNNINKMNDVLTSKYRPKVLDDTDIEYIINKKKDIAFIA